MKVYCSVAGCGAHISEGRLFQFPKTVERAELWRAFCGNVELEGVDVRQLLYKGLICRRHFRVEDFQTPACLKLNRNAVPVLHPPFSSPTLPSSSSSSPAIPFSSSSSCHIHSPSHPSSSLLVRSPSSLVVTSTPGTSAPHRLSVDLTPVSASPSTFDGGANDTVIGSHCQSPALEEERPSLATPSIDIPSSLSADMPDCSESLTTTMICSSVRKGARRSILQDIGMTRVSDLTPRKKVMYNRLKNQRRQWKKLSKFTDNIKSDLSSIPRLMGSRLLHGLDKNFSPTAVTLMKMILREGKRKPKGRRWSHEEKVFAISVFKKSPKCYSLLRALLPLPCRKTLCQTLSHFSFLPGINTEIFHFLSSVVEGMEEKDRYCCLLFDEMSLKPGLAYDRLRDHIVGFEDHGTMGTSNALAKVAMVFMARGLFSAWKQPLAYCFSSSATPSTVLIELLGEVLRNLKQIGLNVVATVCDMGTNNVRALQLMGASFEDPSFEFEGQTVVTVFDPPHLLKCFRNLFMKHNVSIPVALAGNEVLLQASWDHVRQLYDEDAKNPFGRLFPLTEKHMNPKGFDKMRVYLASQVFSLHVGRGVGALVARGALGSSGLATAEFLIAINDLFDALNGDMEAKQGTKKRGPMTKRSGHLDLFTRVEGLLKAMRFIRERGPTFPPSQKGWLATMRGVCKLWEQFKGRFPRLSTRNLNQDPIENLFNVVRHNCGSNHYPGAAHFVSALKTAIINGMVAMRSRGNCEIDGCSVLSNLSKFLSSDSGLGCEPLQGEPGEVGATTGPPKPLKGRMLSLKNLHSAAFLAGYVAEAVLQGSTCSLCQDSLISKNPSKDNFFYALGEQEEDGCPSEGLTSLVSGTIPIFMKKLEVVGHCREVSVKLRYEVSHHDHDETFIQCQSHKMELTSKMYSYISMLAIEIFCRERNRSLKVNVT